MRKALLLPVLLAITMVSCRKEIEEPVAPPTPTGPDFSKMTDSCSYVLDGQPSVYNTRSGRGGGTAAALLDTSTRQYNPDTLQFQRNYTLVNEVPGVGITNRMAFYFIKNFAKTQLTSTMDFGIKAPPSDSVLYTPKGEHPYAIDYERFNRQNGVAIIVYNNGGIYNGASASYISASAYSATTIPNDFQKNSSFNILNYYTLPNGAGHILEARFSVNLVGAGERLHRLENGYVRMRID